MCKGKNSFHIGQKTQPFRVRGSPTITLLTTNHTHICHNKRSKTSIPSTSEGMVECCCRSAAIANQVTCGGGSWKGRWALLPDVECQYALSFEEALYMLAYLKGAYAYGGTGEEEITRLEHKELADVAH